MKPTLARAGAARGFREKKNGKSAPCNIGLAELCLKMVSFIRRQQKAQTYNNSSVTFGSGPRAPTCHIQDSSLLLAWLVSTTENLCVTNLCFAGAPGPRPQATFGRATGTFFRPRRAGNSLA